MEEEGKIFVGGLSWDTTEVGLKTYFQSTFGEVTNCVIMRDANTQRSRGFGFVTFHEAANVGKVLKAGTHMLDGRKIDPKPAVPRGSQPPANALRGGVPNGVGRGRTALAPDGRPWPPAQVVGPAAGGGVVRGTYTGPTKKIFVGGLNPTTTEDDVKTFFSQHGTVTEVILKYDQTNNRMRGFGFVTFDSESAVERLVDKHYMQICTKTVEVKKAEPRNQSSPHGPFVQRSPYWGEAPSYYAYPPRAGYGPPANSGAAYYPPAAYAASPTAAYNGGPNYPAYSTGAYAGNHYNAAAAGPTYGSAASYASYGAGGGYGSVSASGYESYNGTSGQGAHRSTYHGDGGGYAAPAAAAGGAYAGEGHAQAAPGAYNASGGGTPSYGQGQAATVTSTAGEVHQYPAAIYNTDYRGASGAPQPPPNYPPQQSPVGPGSAQGAQRPYTAY